MRLLASVLGVLALSCVDPGPMVCGTVPAIYTTDRLLVGYAGIPSSHRLTVPCLRPNASATGVVVSLADPLGNPVPFTVSEPEPNYGGFAATLAFTAPTAGMYRVTASFEPQLGSMTTTIVIVKDRRDEQPMAVLTTPEECVRVAVGGPLIGCVNSRTRVFLDGGQVFEDVRSGMRGADAALWLWNDSGVSRLEGTERLTLASPVPSDVAPVSATNDSLVLTAAGDLVEYSLRNGALERSVLLADAGVSAMVVPVDGGWVSANGREVCFVAQNQSPRCIEKDLELIGPEANGFWFSVTPGPSSVGFMAFGASPQPELSVVLDLSTTWQQRFELTTSSGLPLLNGSTTVRVDDFTLEEWPGSGFSRVLSGHFVRIGGNQVTVYRR